jgi:hypothetical protein
MAYLTNAWYAIAWADEIKSGIFGRTGPAVIAE